MLVGKLCAPAVSVFWAGNVARELEIIVDRTALANPTCSLAFRSVMCDADRRQRTHAVFSFLSLPEIGPSRLCFCLYASGCVMSATSYVPTALRSVRSEIKTGRECAHVGWLLLSAALRFDELQRALWMRPTPSLTAVTKKVLQQCVCSNLCNTFSARTFATICPPASMC